MYTTKGGKLTGDANYWFWGDEPDNGDYLKLNARYIELPLNIIYKYPLGKGKAIGGLGPYVAYGIGGSWRDKYKGDVTKGKLKFEKYLTDMPDNDKLIDYGRKLDIGINVLLGYELTRHLSATINGGFGLRNLTPLASGEDATDAKQKNIGGSILIGYRF
ncbi:MAG: PorT family protein, partial [Niabella sp.]